MVTFPTFAVPGLGPPTSDYASLLANIGASFENAYARQRERTFVDQLAEAGKRYGLPGAQSAPGAVAPTGQTMSGQPGYNSGGKLPAFAGGVARGETMTMPAAPEVATAVAKYAPQYGLDPKDVLTAMSYETGGTLDSWKAGPTTKWGQHRGLIQWGEPQRAQYGITKDSSIDDQVQATMRYLADRGVKPGMGLLDIYSAINAGGVGSRYHGRSDAAAGGAPGSVADKVAGMAGHARRAEALLARWTTAAPPAGAGTGQVPAAGIASGGDPVEDAKAILANPLSPAPMREYAMGVLTKAGMDPTITGSAGPAATSPKAGPAAAAAAPALALPSITAAGGGPAVVLPEVAGGSAASGPGPEAAAPPAPAPQGVPQAAAPASAPTQPSTPPSPPAAAPASPAAAPPVPVAPGIVPGGGITLPGVHPELLAAMLRVPQTREVAAQIMAAQAGGTKPITQEVGGVLYQLNPRTGQWISVAGQPKGAETVDANGNRFQWNPQTQRYDIPVAGGQSGYRILGITNPADIAERQRLHIPDTDTRPYKVDPKGNPEPINVDPTVFEREQKLRNDFETQQRNKEFFTTQDQFNRLLTSLQDPTGAQDLAIVFSYMKMLDPNSTVREGEQASAANAAGVPEAVIAAYNKLIGGGNLSDEARRQMATAARRIFVQQGSSFNRRVEQQHKLAKQYGLTPENIAQPVELPDLKAPLGPSSSSRPPPPPAPTPTTVPQPAPPPPPQSKGTPGSSRDNPLPISSPADLRNAPSGSWVRYPGFRGQPKIEQVP